MPRLQSTGRISGHHVRFNKDFYIGERNVSLLALCEQSHSEDKFRSMTEPMVGKLSYLHTSM